MLGPEDFSFSVAVDMEFVSGVVDWPRVDWAKNSVIETDTAKIIPRQILSFIIASFRL